MYDDVVIYILCLEIKVYYRGHKVVLIVSIIFYI